jgi:hypothetical protein
VSKLMPLDTSFLQKQSYFRPLCTFTSLAIKDDTLQTQQQGAADDAQSNEVPMAV